MPGPYITIDLEKVEHNAQVITRLCASHGISVTGVTKVTCGMPRVAKAMLRGGVESIGESRMANILRLKANGVNAPHMLLRIPPLSAVEEIVISVDISLNSELSVIEALSKAAVERGLVHEIILMVDLGDLREGIWPDDLMPVVNRVIELEGVRIVGLGTNLSCYGGVVPTEENMNRLVAYADEIRRRFNLNLRYISGGNSSSLNLIASGRMPKAVNHMRIGEGILLGRETVGRMPWPETFQDAFVLNAEIIELKEKPSVPIGRTSQDAFGRTPVFEDRGEMLRAILNIGREDVDVDGICPMDDRLAVLGASSDHLLVDATAAGGELSLGKNLAFSMNYSALLAAMTSAYVEKKLMKQGQVESAAKGITMIGVPGIVNHRSLCEDLAPILIPKFEKLGFPVINKDRMMLPVSPVRYNTGSFEDQKTKVLHMVALTARAVKNAVSVGSIPLVISSDPTVSLGVYTGIAGLPDPPGLLVFSARGGFCIPDENGRGRIRRMALAAALGYGDADLTTCGGICPKFEPENVVLVGLRDVESDEADRINRSRIEVFTMEDIDALGMREVVHRSIRKAAMGTRGVHVTLDLSVLDPTVAPGVIEPARGGISYREAHLAMEMIARSGLLRSLDVVDFAPESDDGAVTVKTGAEFILSLFGKKILGP